MSVSLALVSLLAAATPVIRAADTEGCPDAAAVSQRLAGLLNSGGEPAEPDLVDLTLDGSDLRLRLSRADGTLVAERLIPRSKRCAELADAVAALVAAWEADLRPAPAPPPPARRPPPLAVTGTPPEPERASYEIGVLPALWLGGGRFSLAGTLRAGVWSRRASVGMTVALSATFPVEQGDAGALAWRRHAFSGGVMGRLRHRWLFVDGLAEVVLGWLVINQHGANQASFDPGLTIGLRAGSRVARRLELYASLGAWGAAWTRAEGGAVPHWGLLTGLGASFLFGL